MAMTMNAASRRLLSQFALAVLFLLLTLSAISCNKAPTTTTPNENAVSQTAKRYHMKGKVVSVDKQAGTANVDAETIPDFMDAMTMPYQIKPASQLDQMAVGDSIEADVVLDNDKYWLENVRVTQRGAAPPAKPSAMLHIPAPGDAVPDFEFTNQNGKRIFLKQYRGQALLLTFIYTRCPFPDYCPRVSSQFAEINRKLRADPALDGKTHLLSISFDPAHDTPKVLREYGFACAGSKQAALFRHWEFAVPSAAELPKIANYFGLTYQQDGDGGLITHSLSTAVIGPDGRILKWYHGADWQPADLIKDATDALHSTG
jgi:protein SCO1/2